MTKEAPQPPGAATPAERQTAAAWLAVLIFLWGGNYTWVKVAMADVGPLWFNTFRYGGAAVVFAAVVLAIRRPHLLRAEPGEGLRLVVIGLLQAFAMTTLSALALTMIDAGQVVLIAYSVPVWALIWGALLLAERVTLAAGLGAVLGLAGIAVLADPFAADWSGMALPGVLAATAGVNCWAIGSVLYRRRRWRSPFWTQVFVQILATAVASLLLAPLLENPGEIAFTAPMLSVSAYNAVGPILFGFFCWSQALSRVPASTAGQVMILAPIFGVVQSHVALGEPLSPNLLAAAALVLAGAWLALRTPRGA